MKRFLLIALVLISAAAYGQQTVHYTQYMLNAMSHNPAASGESRYYQALMGRRIQWYGFDLAPITNFVSVSKAFFKRPFRNFWHGAGVYIEEDKAGYVTTKTLYPVYTFHFVTAKKGVLTAGISPGIRFYGINSSLYDPSDPALAAAPMKLTFFPDINAGLRFTSKKILIDLSVKQIYKNKVVQGDKSVGGPVVLTPHGYLTLSRRIFSKSYDYVFEPSVQVRSNFLSFPSISAGCMMFLNKYVGIGLSYRHFDAVSGIVQLKVGRHIVLGFAYDYTVSPLRSSGANSIEMMAGMTPSSFIEHFDDDRTGGATCPVWDF